MKDEEKPKRGGARRGPYSGKKMTFTTKLTESTMERLTAAAKASEMSVSQKGEAAILRGLDAEDDFHLHFAPVLASFERKMILAMPLRGGEMADHQSWKVEANSMVDALADQLRRAVGAVPAPPPQARQDMQTLSQKRPLDPQLPDGPAAILISTRKGTELRFNVLTPAYRRQLSVGESLSEHGITVTKLAAGDERWSLAFMYLGKRVKRVLGLQSEGWNATRALERRDEIRAEIREGVTSLPKGRRTPLRFKELAQWYLDEMEATCGKNVERKRFQLEGRLVPKLGDLIVESMTEEHVGRYAKDLIDTGLSMSTVNRDLATLSHVWSTAVRRRKLRRVPCAILKHPEPEGRAVVFTDAQSDALLAAAKADTHPYLWLFVEVGLGTGMRSAEIVSSRWEQIDWENCRLYLPKAKAGGRMQPLPHGLVEVLRAERAKRPDHEGWLFPSTRTASGHVTEFNAPFKRAVIAAGLSPDLYTPHVMRHTAATIMVRSGAPLPAIQKVTGHKTLQMLMRYTHLADRNIDVAVGALDRHRLEAKAA